jgi:hypothetical protein
MSDAHVARKPHHVTRKKDIAHQAVAFAHVKLAAMVTGRHTGGILAAVLQHGQGVKEVLRDKFVGREKAKNPAHGEREKIQKHIRTFCASAKGFPVKPVKSHQVWLSICQKPTGWSGNARKIAGEKLCKRPPIATAYRDKNAQSVSDMWKPSKKLSGRAFPNTRISRLLKKRKILLTYTQGIGIIRAAFLFPPL